MSFFRLKTDKSGRMYLYEEVRKWEGGKVTSPVSRSHGRVHGFWLAIACLADIFQTKIHGYDPDEAERQTLAVQQREKEEADKQMWEVTHPHWGVSYEDRDKPSSPSYAAPQDVPAAPEKSELAAPSESS